MAGRSKWSVGDMVEREVGDDFMIEVGRITAIDGGDVSVLWDGGATTVLRADTLSAAILPVGDNVRIVIDEDGYPIVDESEVE